tara:strand:+ start:693 stop:1301 length:609 start_codon:yes stop_codon:yes gene_type:complete
MTENFNFNEELLNINEDVDLEESCLIDGTALENTHIKLKCEHKFNYYNIFNEVKCQKTKHNNNETQRLKRTQIKCPYCRNIQIGILPYIEGYEKIRYVNSPEKYVMKNNECNYLFKSGKRKGLPCSKDCFYEKCNQHLKKQNKKQNKKPNKKVIYSYPVLPPPNLCKHLFEKGKNKGNYCACKLKKQYEKNGWCGKHIKKHI